MHDTNLLKIDKSLITFQNKAFQLSVFTNEYNSKHTLIIHIPLQRKNNFLNYASFFHFFSKKIFKKNT